MFVKGSKNIVGEWIFYINWFLPVYLILLKFVLEERAISWISYVLYLGLTILYIFLYRPIMSKSVFVFLVIYWIMLVLNILIVSYKSYVVIEGGTNFLKFIIPVLFFSQISTSQLEDFYVNFYHITLKHMILILPYYYMTRNEIIDYGDFSVLTSLLLIVLMIGIVIFQDKILIGIIGLIITFVMTTLFSSRMPVIAFLLVTFILVFLKINNSSFRIFFISATFVVLTVCFINIEDILSFINKQLIELGIESRTIIRFTNDIGEKSILEMAGSSNRQYIWSTTIEYLKERYFFLPGGFAAIRGITDGNIYFSHNLFLDLFVMFGIFAVPAIFFVIIKIYNLSKIVEKKVFLSFCSFFLFWFFCSLTGAHFLSDSYAIVSWSVLFFTKKQVKEI